MNRFKVRLLAMCGLVALSAAVLASVVAEAGCPTLNITCENGRSFSCAGTQDGDKCVYSKACLNKCNASAEEGDQ
jgi:dissimilatory sulfite reductase (desulfoviridin) alpha/beta subunit